MTRADVTGGRWSLGLAGLVSIGVAAALLLFSIVLLRDVPRSGFRLESRTMLPAGSWQPAESPSCPSGVAPSPVDYRPASELADKLPLHPGELVAVRIDVRPDDSPVPGQLAFSARWPVAMFGDNGPLCAFVVDDGRTEAQLTWETSDSAAADFEIADARPWATTTVEVWLDAVEPVTGTVMATTLTVDDRSGARVGDPLGGRIGVERRAGSQIAISVADDAEIRAGEAQLTLLVSPASDGEPVFNGSVSLEPSVDVAVTPRGAAQDICAVAEGVRCDVGDLVDGQVAELELTLKVDDDWTARGLGNCGAERYDEVRSGLCLVVTAGTGDAGSTMHHVFLEAPRQPLGALSISPFEQPVVVRADGAVDVLLVAQVGEGDVGSVEVVASDCVTIERVPAERDDGDAFLELGEEWWYSCAIEPALPTLRVDLVAVTETGSRIRVSDEIAVTVIAPELHVQVETYDEAVAVTVLNAGDTALSQIGLSSATCRRVTDDVPSPSLRLEPGERVRYECERSDGTWRAYGIDVSGRGVTAVGSLVDAD